MHTLSRLITLCHLLFVANCRHARDELFIIPILWHGPNNQVTEIKEAISLSHLVPGSVAVIPNIMEHKFSDGGVNEMLSRELFSFEALARSRTPYILLEDLRKNWNGKLDAIVFFRDEDFPPVNAMVRDMGLKAPGEEKWIRSPASVTRGCRQDKVDELRELLKPYQYVGMLCYDDFALQTHKLAGTLISDCGPDMCCLAYKERSVLLRKSNKIVKLAKAYIRRVIGTNKPYLATHIRPMPDDCVKLWQSPAEELDQAEMTKICRTDYMYSRLAPNLRALQERYNISTVFVMTHPLIRPRVSKMLQAVGIQPLFIDMSDLNASIRAAAQPLETPLSFSLLAMVEEAVAAEATAFMGSGESSMTGMIIQERLAAGLSPDSSYFMAPHPNCSVLPCTLPDYYKRRDQRIATLLKSGKGGPLISRLPRP